METALLRPRFPDSDPRWARTWDAAVAILMNNQRHVLSYKQRVLVEGAQYGGIWMEGAPQEGLVFAGLADYIPRWASQPTPQMIARANHTAFFALQREDGQIPAWMGSVAGAVGVGFGQIQMVVPIAATAWELAEQTKDEKLLISAYSASSAWDGWLRRYRDTRKTGLVEGFCTYDTGEDLSPRWKGMPSQCPNADARKCARVKGLPRLCPDLSATVYGGRIALAAMANALGKRAEADRWLTDAETIRRLIIEKLYCPEDAAFYDLDAEGNFVRVRGVAMTRVLGEHVLKLDIPSDRHIFDELWVRQIHNPKAFWAPYPFPSIALNDPTFSRPVPLNSWGGASQPLTALRTLRWMEHYGKHKELIHLMRQWVEAISRPDTPLQQIDPVTGEFSKPESPGYSPTALIYLEFIRRLQNLPADKSGTA